MCRHPSVKESSTVEHDIIGAHSALPQRRARKAIWEIAFVVLCVLIAEWAVLPFFGRNFQIGLIPVALAFAFMLFSQHAQHESARDLGLRIDNFPQAID